MAGHSKWKNIQHRKSIQDLKRGKVFTKLLREVTIAVKMGGTDLHSNSRLKLAVQNAKSMNVPKTHLERAINKGTDQNESDLSEFIYEGYTKNSVALIIETATNNRTRTVANIRSYLHKNGGRLGSEGCHEFLFDIQGTFTLSEYFDLHCSKNNFEDLRKKFEELNLPTLKAFLNRTPKIVKFLSSDDHAIFLKLLHTIQEDEDVQQIYHNAKLQKNL